MRFARRRTPSGRLRRSRRSAWLPAQDWEALLAQPLDEVRRQLRIEPAPSYEAVRSSGAPADVGGGVLAA